MVAFCIQILGVVSFMALIGKNFFIYMYFHYITSGCHCKYTVCIDIIVLKRQYFNIFYNVYEVKILNDDDERYR